MPAGGREVRRQSRPNDDLATTVDAAPQLGARRVWR